MNKPIMMGGITDRQRYAYVVLDFSKTLRRLGFLKDRMRILDAAAYVYDYVGDKPFVRD